jgi:hypothetical protein
MLAGPMFLHLRSLIKLSWVVWDRTTLVRHTTKLRRTIPANNLLGYKAIDYLLHFEIHV